MQIFLDDRMVDESEAMVSVYDHGFLYGDGIYETMRAYDGVVFRIDEHLERLERSASLIRLETPGRKSIAGAVLQTLQYNRLRDAYIRVTLSRGKGPIGLDPALCRRPTLVVIAEPFHPYPGKLYEDGVFMVISSVIRNHVRAINPMIKSLNFLNNILAKAEAKDRGAYEAIMLNADGHVTEGTVCNIFFVIDDILCTPSVGAGILDGITRDIVISLAAVSGLTVREGLFSPRDIFGATEVFFTNTTAEVMPVSRIDDTVYNVGSITGRLRSLYREEVEKYVHTTRSRDVL